MSVRLGGVLLYVHDIGTVRTVGLAWRAMQKDARLLPQESQVRAPPMLQGMKEPTVMVELMGSPRMFTQLERPERAESRMLIWTGRLRFDIRDRAAYISTSRAWREAERLAERTFLPPSGRPSARAEAAHSAARLLTSGRVMPPRSGRVAATAGVRVSPAGGRSSAPQPSR